MKKGLFSNRKKNTNSKYNFSPWRQFLDFMGVIAIFVAFILLYILGAKLL